jgi:hypothetical protein
MTKRDFFILIIKVFGLFSVVTSLFSVLPSNISFAMMDIDTLSILWIFVTIVVVVGLFIVLIFKADKVVRLLKLDKGFDDDKIEIGSLKATNIIKLGTFIIGGFLVLHNIPAFLSHSLFAFKGDIIGLEYNTQDKFNWIVSGLNLTIGFLLITNYDFVAKRLKAETTESE